MNIKNAIKFNPKTKIMKKFQFLLFACLFIISIHLSAQDTIPIPRQIDMTTIGVGMGLDMGGFGGNVLVYPAENFGLFAGVGYALAGVGFNAGAKVRLISKNPVSKVNPYALAMYGYNAAIAVSGATQYNKLFYGPTFGIGIDYRPNPYSGGYWSFALFVPIRSTEVDKYIDDLKTNHNIEFKTELIPIAISIGYRFIIN
jgi:hypothetical protein